MDRPARIAYFPKGSHPVSAGGSRWADSPSFEDTQAELERINNRIEEDKAAVERNRRMLFWGLAAILAIGLFLSYRAAKKLTS